MTFAQALALFRQSLPARDVPADEDVEGEFEEDNEPCAAAPRTNE